MNIFERVKAYKDGMEVIRDWLGEGGITVSQVMAQKRANICIACPKNVGGWMFVDAVAAAIRRQTEIKNKLQLRVEGEKQIKTCAACGCASKLKIWIPLRNILPDEDERVNFDPKCWLLKPESEL